MVTITEAISEIRAINFSNEMKKSKLKIGNVLLKRNKDRNKELIIRTGQEDSHYVFTTIRRYEDMNKEIVIEHFYHGIERLGWILEIREQKAIDYLVSSEQGQIHKERLMEKRIWQ